MLDSALILATRFLVGGGAQWIGCAPSERQRVYFANHGSHLDALLVWGALPRAHRRAVHPVAAADYWGAGGLSAAVARRALNVVLIDREGAGRDPLAPLRAKLGAGASLIIFPEGTRGPERLPGPFKSGIFHLARAFPQVEFVPVFLENPSRAMPKGAPIPIPIACAARFGAPIRLEAGETKPNFLARAHAAVTELGA
jgi:1-acyl-sn-glycerol-3-phosphate acyltransferase